MILFTDRCYAEPLKVTGGIEISFAPKADATKRIVREIELAGSEIVIQAYFQTFKPVAVALKAAKERGIKIKVLPDRVAKKVRQAASGLPAPPGIPAHMDLERILTRNKSIVIDGSILITGSFDFTKAEGEKNADNFLVLKGNKALVEAYVKSFTGRNGHVAGEVEK